MKNPLTYEQTIANAAAYCSIQERCKQEVFAKLKTWGIEAKEIQKILDFLTKEKYLDEKRFASAFVRGKFHHNKWGKIKILHELKQKGIQRNLIAEALQEIDEEDYLQLIRALIKKKDANLKGSKTFEKKGKILNSLLSKGFESELIYKLLGQLGDNEVD